MTAASGCPSPFWGVSIKGVRLLSNKKRFEIEKNPDGTIGGELEELFDLQKSFWEDAIYPILESKGIKFGKTEEEKKPAPASPRFVDENEARRSLQERLKKYKERKRS